MRTNSIPEYIKRKVCLMSKYGYPNKEIGNKLGLSRHIIEKILIENKRKRN